MRKNASSKKYVYIATEHKSSGIRRFATQSTVKETAREKLQKQCHHVDFEKTTALSNLRSLLAQGLQQGSYYNSSFYSNNTFPLTLRSQLSVGNLI